MLANGLSAPQHSTYFVILLEGRDLVGTPGVAGKDDNNYCDDDKCNNNDESKIADHIHVYHAVTKVESPLS